MIIKTPFYSQKWDLSNWEKLGFDSYEDANYWEKSSCGVLSLKMAIDSILEKKNEQPTGLISSYISKGVEIGAYKDSTGWSHSGLVDLAKCFNISATSYGNCDEKKLIDNLNRGFLPIISIKWAFENNKSLKERILFWKKYGGHLALVVGYEKDKFGALVGFYIHHTSIIKEYNWKYKLISLGKFKKGFTGRCIVIKSQINKSSY